MELSNTCCGVRSERGASIIEILMAIAVFSIGILGVIKMQTMALRTNTYSGNLTRAVVDHNQQKSEDLLALDYSHADLAAVPHGPETQDNFSTSWTVDPDTPYPGAKTITITTSWNDLGGNHSISTTMIKSQLY